jgi:hypothetical protein
MIQPPPTGVGLYARFAFAGAVCCAVTHGALTPVDVVKTRIQLEPEVYNKVSVSNPSYSATGKFIGLCLGYGHWVPPGDLK